MKIQIASDLHLEFYEDNNLKFEEILKPSASILILAGDILYLKNVGILSSSFVKYLESNWERVIIVLGNHDYYNMNYNDSRDQKWFKSINYDFANIEIVNNSSVTIDDITFICSTLWSDTPTPYEFVVSKYIADYSQIKEVDVNTINMLNKDAIKYIKDELKTVDNAVIVSHHLPTWECVSTQYKNDNLTYAFANNLDDLMLDYSDKIKAWIHGHSHDFKDEIIHGIRVVRNPLGYAYRNENPTYINDFVIEI
jgi:predicted phosphodiesterase